jgi:hypothetical protein
MLKQFSAAVLLARVCDHGLRYDRTRWAKTDLQWPPPRPVRRLRFTIISNTLVQTNTTPFVAQLPTKSGYFKAPAYRMVFEMPGYAPAEVSLDSSVSGWYWANIAFGGVVGMLIVDPLTGAMYNLKPEKIEQPLSASQAQVIRDGKGMLVVLASQATEHERAEMVRVN